MRVSGPLSVKLSPQDDSGVAAGRMIIRKTYEGPLTGTACGQMISKRLADGPSVYFAIEEVSATLEGKQGAFTLVHKGYMDQHGQSLDIQILEGSGTRDLRGITGSMQIEQVDDGHVYELTYAFD
jgi:hypothetical protein